MEAKTVLKTLKKNYSKLREKVVGIPGILAKCRQLNLLSEEEIENIRNSYVNKTTGEKWDTIYEGLQKRDLTIDNLMQIFENENEHIFELLGLQQLGGFLTRKTYGKPPKIVDFVGRSDKLDEIEEKLNSQSDESACQCAVICVGFGGIGKTFLAGKYIEKNSDKYKAIIWLDADHKDELLNINEEFIRFGVEANIPGADLSDKESYKAILHWFDKPENFGCLLVFDNVNNWDSIKAYVPKKGCKVLITSRNKLFVGSVTIFLDKYKLDDVENLFKMKLSATFGESQNRDSEEIKKFSEEHDYNPLAISQALSYIETLNLTIKEYMKEKGKLRHLMNISDEVKEGNLLLKSYLPVLETFMLSVIQVHSKDPNAVHNLNMMAFLVPNNIPRKIFEPQVLAILSKYSLITLELGKYFRIHRLVQDSILFKLNEKFRKPDEIIYTAEVNYRSVLTSTYKFIEKHYPYGKWRKKYITLKSHLLPHFGSLYNKNLLMEQRGKIVKLPEIEVQEVPEIIETRNSPIIYSTMPIFDNNPIAEAKKILIKLDMAKEYEYTFEEREQMLNTVLKVYQSHLIPDDEQISEVLFLLGFLYLEESYKKSTNSEMREQFIQKSHELCSKGENGKILSKVIESYKLELMGFNFGNCGNREFQLKCYLDAYMLQLASLPKSPEMRSKVTWEKYHDGISLENGVSAGRFKFPGFAHYRGRGSFGRANYELEIFVGRGYHKGKIIPGKFIRFPNFDSFQCPSEGKEIKPDIYEILKIENGGYKWVLSQNGDIVENSVEGGFEDEEKKITSYIGRIYIPSEGNPTEPSIGKISNFTKGGCVAPLWNQEYLFPQYEILVLL